MEFVGDEVGGSGALAEGAEDAGGAVCLAFLDEPSRAAGFVFIICLF